jgi:hypothetical protein
MFCSGCGKEISEGSKFCPGCGKATDGTPNVTTVASDPTKILKEGEFRRFEKVLDSMSKKNDGKLTLFCDRVEWRGRVNEDIKIADIVKFVETPSANGDTIFEITDNTGKTRKFVRSRSLLKGIERETAREIGRYDLVDHDSSIASGKAEIESWHAAIEKLRGRL